MVINVSGPLPVTTALSKNRLMTKIEINGTSLLSSELTIQLGNALDQAEDLGQSSSLVFRIVGQANPNALRVWPGRTDIQSVNRWERILRRIERTNVTTIAIVEHACSALALELLMVADRRLATITFSMQCSIPGNEVWPSMALHRLVRQIGESQARKMLLDGSDISAQRGLELSIIDQIVDDLQDENFAALLLSYVPSHDFPTWRRLMLDGASSSFDEALGAHLAACDRALRRSSNAAPATGQNGNSEI